MTWDTCLDWRNSWRPVGEPSPYRPGVSLTLGASLTWALVPLAPQKAHTSQPKIGELGDISPQVCPWPTQPSIPSQGRLSPGASILCFVRCWSSHGNALLRSAVGSVAADNPDAARLDPPWHLQRPHVPWLLLSATEHGWYCWRPLGRGQGTPLVLAPARPIGWVQVFPESSAF